MYVLFCQNTTSFVRKHLYIEHNTKDYVKKSFYQAIFPSSPFEKLFTILKIIHATFILFIYLKTLTHFLQDICVVRFMIVFVLYKEHISLL